MGIVDIEKFVEKDEIRESNILIGEFLGWKLEDINSGYGPDHVWQFVKYENGEAVDFYDGGEMCVLDKNGSIGFDFDWNWLMKAYIKIAGMASVIAIEKNVCYIKIGGIYSDAKLVNFDFTTSRQGKDLKESVWLEVVDFVKWYNIKKEKDETKI
jgi:hypothetical protein